MFNVIVVHFDELILKGANRAFFERKLISNLREALGKDVFSEAAKFVIYLKQADDISVIFEKLKLIPGISNFSGAIECDANIDAISAAALSIVQHYQPKTFKIETSRSCKKFPMNSMETNCEVGARILQQMPNLKVDVHRPDLMVCIEIQSKKAFVLGKKEQGIGGLPVGTAGKIVCLLSGGIDSPVAAFSMMKRGAKIIFVHCHNQTINQSGVEQKIKDLVSCLSRVQGKSILYIVAFDELQKEVIAKIAADSRMIVYRRLMFKIAEMIAKKQGALAIVTGDSLGQVASQTLENLEVIYEATDMLKFSPLIGTNKREIIDIARKIGTYEISIRPHEDCCSFMISKHPETRAHLEDIKSQEKNLQCSALLRKAIKNSRAQVCARAEVATEGIAPSS
ncbi:tRNA 4-thiouridine(8) synthase ThiI [Candidatus Falkowbacteria bacterium]|nr:tRNA 4-thiouridine(8) synthase ThiI [Candidatus Falkowbacteria bacterium]